VVISPLYEYLNTPGVRIYHTTQEFIAAVEDALGNDSQSDRELRQSTVRDCTWDVRSRQVGEMVRSLLQSPRTDWSEPSVNDVAALSAAAPSSRMVSAQEQVRYKLGASNKNVWHCRNGGCCR